MELDREIKHLLNEEWDYCRGLEIYRQVGDNPYLADLLSKDPNSTFYNKKLRQELVKIIAEPSDHEDTSTVSTTDNVKPKQVEILLADWPELLRPVVKERNAAVQERDYLKGKLSEINDQDKRRDTAFRILALDEIIDSAWEKIHYYREHNVLPIELHKDDVSSLFEGKSIADILKIKMNYRTYLSRSIKGDRKSDKIPFYESVLLECEKRLAHEQTTI